MQLHVMRNKDTVAKDGPKHAIISRWSCTAV